VPLYPLSVLSFIRRSSSCHSETGGPMVVHCSAGVGRTGTYIVIDTMLKKLNEQQSLNIPSFLKHIRKQRCNLVQTEAQFIFLYDVLLEVVQLLNIGYKNFDANLTNIEQQFQLIRRSTEEKPMNASYIHVRM
jgi:protein tyrosine phosphatase